MSPNHDVGELLAGGAPWEINAICRDCGCPYTALTFSPKRRDYEGPPFRYGSCGPCTKADEEEHQARMRSFEEGRKKKEPEVPVLEKDKLKRLEAKIQADVFDPFSERKDQ